MRLSIKIVSNEFTHNPQINNLMMLDKSKSNRHHEQVLTQLRESNNEDLIIFHDKILDKLF